MPWIELITLLSIVQLFVFGVAVGKARGKHNLPHPAMAGNEMVERYIRGHLNSVEWIVIFLPALWLAAHYWNPQIVAGFGLVYLIGRVVYFMGYVKNVKQRLPGFIISTLTTMALILLGFIGVIKALLV